MKHFFLLLSVLLFSATGFAHPHAFLDMKNKVLINEGKLYGFAMTWILDEIASAELIYELQRAKNKKNAERKLTEELNQSAINNHYFSELYDDQNTPIKFKATPTHPSIRVQDNRIFYDFELTLAQPQPVSGRSFHLFTFEPSYYLYMGYERFSDVTITPQQGCTVSLIEPKVNQSLRLYASALDKTQTPDMPLSGNLSLGGQFAQKVSVQCQ